TMASVETLEAHYRGCQRLLAEACASTGLAYLGTDRTLLVERLSRGEAAKVVSSDYCLAAFRTSERALDPRVLPGRLRGAPAATPRVRFIASAEVLRVAWTDRIVSGSRGARTASRTPRRTITWPMPSGMDDSASTSVSV